MKDKNSEIEDIAFVDSSGNFIDSADFANLNLKFPQLEKLLDNMADKGEWNRLIIRSVEGLGDVWIRRLDSSGKFWKVWQEKEVKGIPEENPSIRFLYNPEDGIIRPVDYSDPFVHLDGDRRTSQILIASFLTHWLSGIIILAEERENPLEFKKTGVSGKERSCSK